MNQSNNAVSTAGIWSNCRQQNKSYRQGGGVRRAHKLLSVISSTRLTPTYTVAIRLHYSYIKVRVTGHGMASTHFRDTHVSLSVTHARTHTHTHTHTVHTGVFGGRGSLGVKADCRPKAMEWPGITSKAVDKKVTPLTNNTAWLIANWFHDCIWHCVCVCVFVCVYIITGCLEELPSG